MAKTKKLNFAAVEYTDAIVSAGHVEEYNTTDERVKIVSTFETLEEAKEAAEKHAEENNLTYKF